jgi:hypothetical protein
MKELTFKAAQFTLIRHYNGKFFAYETAISPGYSDVEDDFEFVCYPVLFDNDGIGTPHCIFKMKLLKKEFELANLVVQD